jgi:hypothetical protein
MILQPKEKGDRGYTWPALAVRQSQQNVGGGLGVFATRKLKPGIMIPILGHRVAQADGLTHGWVYYGSIKGAVDGHPSINPYKGVGSFGLSIAMMVNEPTRAKPNCIFKMDHIVIAEPIRKGEELTVYYGKNYELIRRIKGYTLRNNTYLDEPHPKLYDMRYPRSKKRNNNIQQWLDVITERERREVIDLTEDDVIDLTI